MLQRCLLCYTQHISVAACSLAKAQTAQPCMSAQLGVQGLGDAACVFSRLLLMLHKPYLHRSHQTDRHNVCQALRDDSSSERTALHMSNSILYMYKIQVCRGLDM
jgi:hypothetical protein